MPVQLAALQLATLQLVTLQLATLQLVTLQLATLQLATITSRHLTTRHHHISPPLHLATLTSPLTQKDLYCDPTTFLKFRYENVIKNKNKPDPALVQT
jgi:hypothetical protein